jgi:transmembrane sensor
MTQERPDRDEARSEQAIAWLVRLNSGEATGEDWRGLEAWLAADPANLAEYARIEALWAELDDRAAPLRAGLADAEAPGSNVVAFTPRPRKAARKPRPAWSAAAAAAALALAVGGVGLIGYLRARPATYQTAPGQTEQIALADGTKIALNGGSTIAVGLDARARRVSMGDAEAAFDVTKDPRRPFLIAAGDARIRVVGTAFDVVHQGERLVVTVRRGVVEVGRARPGGQVADVIRVPAGYQLVRDDDRAPTQVTAVDPDEAFAWRQGRLICRDESLGQVVGALNRAFPVPIETRGAAAELRFSGVLVLDDEDAVVRRLQAFLPIEADRSHDRIALVSRP